MNTSKKLIRRLKEELPELNLPADAWLQRTYRSRQQAEGGTFSWYVQSHLNRAIGVGSEDTMGDLLKAKKIGFYRDRFTTTYCVCVSDPLSKGE